MRMEAAWGTTNLNNKPEEYSSSTEREARSIALEKAYVHDVYQQIASHFSDSRYRAWPKVKQFLLELEPGSIVCDVGCGNGKYLDINPSVYKIGIDRCSNLTGAAKEKNFEVLISDNLNIPFRDDCFDAVVSIAVIHHFATTERRVAALKELARVLRIGGRLMVSVWAMEQRHRRFESQDVLVPWNRPMTSSSDDKTSSIERDLNSTTTTTSDDDAATHYHAYTQTSDSDHSFPSESLGCRKRGRIRHRGRSIDPTCPSSSQSSSDLSSPNESCYSFVRRALQKLAGTRRNRGGRRPWFLQGLDIPVGDDDSGDQLVSMDEDIGGEEFRANLHHPDEFMPIELRQLESTDFVELFQLKNERHKPKGMLFSNVLYPRRRRTLEATSEIQHSTDAISAQPKSKSLSDLFGLIPVGILRSQRKSAEDFIKDKKSCTVLETADEFARSTSSISGIGSSNDEIQFPDCVRHKAVQTESIESLDKQSSSQQQSHRPSADLFLGNLLGKTSNDMTHHHHHYQHHHHHHHHHSGGSSVSGHSLSGHDDTSNVKKLRPVLVKQKQSICSPSQMGSDEGSLGELCCSLESDRLAELGGGTPGGLPLPPGGIPGHEVCWGEMKKSVRDLPELKPPSGGNTLQVPTPIPPTRGGIAAGSSFWKQSSLNEELIFSERLKEKEMLKQNIQKQCSLNEELIYKRRENTRWDQMKEAFLNSSNVKCLQLIKNGISNRFRGSDGSQNQSSSSDGGQGGGNGSMGSGGSSSIPSRPSTTQASSSIRNGIVRMLQNWKQGEDSSSNGNTFLPSHSSSSLSPNSFLGARRGSKESSSTRRGLFPPFFLRRSSAGSLNVTKGTKGDLLNDPSSVNGNILSPPHLKRRPSENELLHECSGGNGNKLLPGVRHVRKLSREEGSDSSKDSSFQSDTSVDSEDSFASVIFIPNKGGLDGTNDAFTFNTETRANSTDSDRSPKSPASRLSPPNHNLPKSPSPLANELLRRRSPEVSPTKLSLYGGGGGGGSGGGHKETSKFVFDESATTRLQSPAISSTSICEQGELTTHSPTVTVSLIETKVEEEEDEEEVSSKEEVTSVTTSVPQESLHYPHPHPQQQVHHQKKKVERIEVLRKPAVLPEGHKVTRQLVRRSLPKALAFELFNPETDDADTSDTSSSSPNSISSVVSVVNEESLSQATTSTGEQTTSGSGGKPSGVKEDSNCKSSLETTQALPELSEELLIPIPEEDRMAKETTSSQQVVSNAPDTSLEEEDNSKDHGTTQSTTSSSGGGGGSGGGSRRSSILEAAASVVSSFENLVVQSSPKTRRKLTLAKLGSTSEWLLSLPSEAATTSSNNNSVAASSPVSSSSASTTSSSAPTTHHPPLAKRPSGERRTTSGEKLLLGDVKKYQQRGPDARWPSSIIDESPPQTAKTEETLSHPEGPSSAEAPNKILEEMEERDSLFDSLENLCSGRKDHPSRNPSIDSSVRMSSTCSIRGGESFESWSSAKSSLTNSSSTHQQKPSVASTIPLPPLSVVNRIPASMCNLPGSSGRIRHQGTSSKSSSAAGEDTESSAAENSTALTYHRYYHVFREGELDKLIEKYVKNLHIISSYYDHANWCIIAEKVQVWTI